VQSRSNNRLFRSIESTLGPFISLYTNYRSFQRIFTALRLNSRGFFLLALSHSLLNDDTRVTCIIKRYIIPFFWFHSSFFLLLEESL
jgi:hypothetical protein